MASPLSSAVTAVGPEINTAVVTAFDAAGNGLNGIAGRMEGAVRTEADFSRSLVDRNLDALTANFTAPGEPNAVWFNTGDGTFTAGQTLGNSNSYDLALGDADGDGDLDAFIANYGQANRVWINQGGAQAGTEGQFLDSGLAALLWERKTSY